MVVLKLDKETQTDANEDDYLNTIKKEVKVDEAESSSSSSSSSGESSVKELSAISEHYEEEEKKMELEAQEIPFRTVTQFPIIE